MIISAFFVKLGGHCGDVDPPGPPQNLRLSDMKNILCTLTWNAPGYDGGSPIIGYYVESYIGSCWNSINAIPLQVCSIDVQLLDTNSDNEFRVCAVNAVGVGLPSEIISVAPPPCIGLFCLPVKLLICY